MTESTDYVIIPIKVPNESTHLNHYTQRNEQDKVCGCTNIFDNRAMCIFGIFFLVASLSIVLFVFFYLEFL